MSLVQHCMAALRPLNQNRDHCHHMMASIQAYIAPLPRYSYALLLVTTNSDTPQKLPVAVEGSFILFLCNRAHLVIVRDSNAMKHRVRYQATQFETPVMRILMRQGVMDYPCQKLSAFPGWMVTNAFSKIANEDVVRLEVVHSTLTGYVLHTASNCSRVGVRAQSVCMVQPVLKSRSFEDQFVAYATRAQLYRVSKAEEKQV